MKTGFLTRNIRAPFDRRWLPKVLLASPFVFAAAQVSLVAKATLASTVIMTAFLIATPPAFAATGDLVGTLTFSQNCSSGLGVGITFDGDNLWVSCFSSGASNPDLLKINPATGAVITSYKVAGGLGSLAYDSRTNVIWAGEGAGSFSGSVIKIPLSGSGTSKVVAGPFIPGFPVPEAFLGSVDDGLAIDALANVLYVSYDGSQRIFKYNSTTGVFLGSIPAPGPASLAANSGLAIGGNLLYEGSDGASHVFVVDKNTLLPSFDFATGGTRDESLTCDTKTFFASQGKHVMWSKEAFNPNRAFAFEIPLNTCASGGGGGGTKPPPRFCGYRLCR